MVSKRCIIFDSLVLGISFHVDTSSFTITVTVINCNCNCNYFISIPLTPMEGGQELTWLAGCLVLGALRAVHSTVTLSSVDCCSIFRAVETGRTVVAVSNVCSSFFRPDQKNKSLLYIIIRQCTCYKVDWYSGLRHGFGTLYHLLYSLNG